MDGYHNYNRNYTYPSEDADYYGRGRPTGLEHDNQGYGYGYGYQRAQGEEDQGRMFDEEKNCISFGALGNDHPCQGTRPQPVNTWQRGHPKYYRCRG